MSTLTIFFLSVALFSMATIPLFVWVDPRRARHARRGGDR